MDNLSFCCVHMLVYINDYILICQYKQNVDKYCTVTNTYTSTLVLRYLINVYAHELGALVF